jgi:hypothetical protein
MSIIEKALNKAKDEGQKLNNSADFFSEIGKNADTKGNFPENKPAITVETSLGK